ncbi:unnamed protein product [Somion occarium]|uniref:Uncharacterized protein n=1 Tax=Somion occarium TaxID=3059160 RepID=A0ABP1E0S5_9APHY
MIDQSVLTLVLQEVPQIMKLDVMVTESLSTKLATVQQISVPQKRRYQCFVPSKHSASRSRKQKHCFDPNNGSLSSMRPSTLLYVKCQNAYETTPFLSSLDLRAFDTRDDSDTGYPENYKAVDLNHLQWLHIDGSQYYSCFLRNLEVAPGASVFLDMSTNYMFDFGHINTMIYGAI